MTDNNWTAIRRSTPAEEIGGIPDSSIVWACWRHPDLSPYVTIYLNSDNDAYVVVQDEEENDIRERKISKREAKARALEIQENLT